MKRGNSVGNITSSPSLIPKPKLPRRMSDGSKSAETSPRQPPIPPKPQSLVQNFALKDTSPELPREEPKQQEKGKTEDENQKNNFSVDFMIAAYDHAKGKEEELELSEGDIVCVLEQTSDDWFYVTSDAEVCGFVASSFLAPFDGTPPEHLLSLASALQQGGDELSYDSVSPREDTHSTPSLRASRRNTSSIPTFPTYGNRVSSGKFSADHNPLSSSKISEKIRQGSKFLKRKRRRSIGSTRGNNSSVSIVRQSSSQSLASEPSSPQSNSPTAPNLSPRTRNGSETTIPFIVRGKIVKEILATEKHYISVLTTLLDVCFTTFFISLY